MKKRKLKEVKLGEINEKYGMAAPSAGDTVCGGRYIAMLKDDAMVLDLPYHTHWYDNYGPIALVPIENTKKFKFI